MYPDPGVYLRGIRRELLQAAEEAEAAGEQMQAIVFQRMAETLVRLLTSQERMPEILDRLLPKFFKLLRDITDRMQDLQLDVPAGAVKALAEYKDLADKGKAVQLYDNCNSALVACLAEISQRQASHVGAAALGEWAGQAASALEETLRAARFEATAAVRSGAKSTAAEASLKPLDAATVTDYLRISLPQSQDLCVTSFKHVIGLNSKEIYLLEISDYADWPTQLVLRRNGEIDTVGNYVADEFALLDYLYRQGIIVPRPLLAESNSEVIERSFIISERKPGQARSIGSLGNEAVPAVLEMAKQLAALHRLDARELPESCHRYPGDARERTLAMLDRFYRMTKEAEFEPGLTQEAAFSWLRANVDRVGPQITLVHGDFDFRNLLFDGQHLSAILDWELAHLGHPAEDLAYCRPQIEEVMDWNAFLDVYYQHGGVQVSDDEVRYFQIYSDVFRLATMYPATLNYLTGKSSNILMGTLGMFEFQELMSRLAGLLQREAQPK